MQNNKLSDFIVRRPVVAVIGFIGIIGLLFLFIYLTAPKPKKQQGNTAEPSPQTLSSVQTRVTQGKIYEDSYFTLRYPDDWRRTVTQENGGEIVLFEPINPGSQKERLEIQISPTSSKIPMGILDSLGYTKMPVTLSGIQGYLLKSPAGNLPFQEIAEIFEYKDKTFSLRGIYLGNTRNSEIEQEIQSMLASLQIR